MRPALVLALLLSGCASFADRYATGNGAMSTPEGAAYLVLMGPRLQRALNDCIPVGTPGASPTIVLVADVLPDGSARDVDIEPDGPGTTCVETALAATPLPRPPLKSGAERFPVGLKIETR